MNKSIELVKEFHQLFDQPIADTPSVPDVDRIKLRLSIILEEFSELADASGVYLMFAGMLKAKSDSIIKEMEKRNFEEKVDLVACYDAIIDTNYVLDGTTIEYGFSDIFEEGMREVHSSNMSKMCNSMEEVEQTMKHYKENEKVDSYFDVKGNKFIVKNSDTKKVLKNVNYKPADLKSIVEK